MPWMTHEEAEMRSAAMQEPLADIADRIEAVAVGADFEAERFAVEGDQVQANDPKEDDDA